MESVVKLLAAALAAGIAAFYSAVGIRYCVRICSWLPHHERWVRAHKGLCLNCGYDLTANVSGVCPECGSKVTQKTDDKGSITPSLITESQPRWVGVFVVTTMLLTVILCRTLSV